jgi:TolB-like protein
VTDPPTEREAGGPWGQLRRRKVVQWGLAYAATAWTALQVIEYFGETYAWPPAVRQIAALALPLGLLFVLVLAWYHGDKGAQQVSRPELAILIALVAVVGGTVWWYVSRLDESAWQAGPAAPSIRHEVPQDAASVAVLPFVNMSEDPSNEYFSDGLSEEILNSLSRIPRLYVPARTSSFQFKGDDLDVVRVASELGVATVLEGSVRKSGNRIRVTAQLINGVDGYQLWSQTYDRELADIFAIQSEIADAIASALKIQLTAQQKLAATQAPPTSNLDAYEAYLLGRFELNKRGEHTQASIPYFEKAVALDPDFAVAWADLALVQALLHNSRPRSEWPALRTRARASLDRALAVDADRPEVLAAAGYVVWFEGDEKRALDLIERSLDLLPNNGEALVWRRWLLNWLGRFDEVLPASYEGVKRDPLSWLALANHAQVLMQFGRTDEVPPILDKLRTLGRLDVVETLQRFMAWRADDRPAAIRHCIEEAEIEGSDACGDSQTLWSLGLRDELARITSPGLVHALFGEYEDALPLIRKAVADGEESPLLLAKLLCVVGEYPEAAGVFAELYADGLPMDYDDAASHVMTAAHAARSAGFDAQAKAYRDHAARMLAAIQKAGFENTGYRALGWAMLHAYDGREQSAAQSLIAAIPGEPHLFLAVEQEPLLVEILKRPDVQAAIATEKARAEGQRVEVLAMLCAPKPAWRTFRPTPGTCR